MGRLEIKRHPVYTDYGFTEDGRAFSFKRGKCYELNRVSDGKYLGISVWYNKRQFRRRIHVLMLETFRGQRPDGYDSCHRDGDRLNNRIDNLRWCPKSENTVDNYLHGKTKGRGSTTHYSDDIKAEYYSLREQGLTNTRATAILGIPRTTPNTWKNQ